MSTDPLDALFSRPEDDLRTQRSWQTFHRVGNVPSDALRRIVGESWRRCHSANVDPSRHSAPIELLGSEIEHHLHRHHELLEACTPVMSMARDYLAETGTVMVLADSTGAVLQVEGDSRTLAPAENIHLLPGAVWNEFHCGTNAIGTALSLEQPVQIHSEEHYCEGIKRWTCSAAVIRHPSTQDVLGVLDISGLSGTYNRQSLPLVVNSASRIEAALAQHEMLLRYLLLDRCLPWVSNGDGSIVLDRHGFAIKLNEHAGRALAALGVSLDLRQPMRLRIDADQQSDGARAPEWLRPEWIEPVTDNGARIGSIVRLPSRGVARRSVHRQIALPEKLDLRGFRDAVGEHPDFRRTVLRAANLAKSRAPILLLGETGTGKDVFARGIHESSPVRDGPFVALNCGGLSRDLLASELFGYREGAFTGSRRGGMAGKIEAADGGTLFLDEVGEMPLDLQPYLLRVLEDGEIIRLGENAPRKINFRLVAATNRDLRTEIAEGRFRMDLYYRISVTSLHLHPLREIADDVEVLARHFMALRCTHHGVPEKRFDAAVMAQLRRYAWPGNVRELRNLVETLVVTVPDDVVLLEDLPAEILDGVEPRPALPSPEGEAVAPFRTLEQSERRQIRLALEETGGNATLAAQKLGIAKSTLYVKLKKFGLERHLESTRH